MLGLVVGFQLWGHLSESYGRKKVINQFFIRSSWNICLISRRYMSPYLAWPCQDSVQFTVQTFLHSVFSGNTYFKWGLMWKLDFLNYIRLIIGFFVSGTMCIANVYLNEFVVSKHRYWISCLSKTENYYDKLMMDLKYNTLCYAIVYHFLKFIGYFKTFSKHTFSFILIRRR